MAASGVDKEKWFELYQGAVLWLKHSVMAGRIADACAEIVNRTEVLRDFHGLHEAKRHAIEDVLHNLQVLEREDAAITAKKKRKKAATALERLLEIAPRSKRPQEEG